jgi:quinol-cytochrome oxidoreductase complex cytochrome b subunit
MGIAALWPWNLPTYAGDLSAAGVVTEPDWYFLWEFKLVDFQGVTPVIAVAATNVIILYVLFLPFLDRSKRTHPRDRPLFIFLGTSLLEFFVLMSVWGGLTPGVAISPMVVAERLVPLFAFNAVFVALFHWRYQRNYRARLAARDGLLSNRPGAYPASGGKPMPSVTEARAHD